MNPQVTTGGDTPAVEAGPGGDAGVTRLDEIRASLNKDKDTA
jgi:hypothetical protein